MKLIKFVVTCLLGVSLIACQDKIRQEEDILSKPSPEENIEKDFIPLFEAEMALPEEQLKGFQVGFDRLSNTTGDQSKIFSPRIRFRKRDNSVELLLRREKGGNVKFIRERAVAKVIPIDGSGKETEMASNKAKVRIWVRKPNPKKNNLPFTFEEGETWHAMIIMNSDNKTITDKSGKQVAVFGEEEEDRENLNRSGRSIVEFVGKNQTAGSGDKDTFRVARYGQEVGRHSIPLISNWKELKIQKNAKPSTDPRVPDEPNTLFRLAKNEDSFTIKPQGLLLHYQIVANVFEGIDMRRAGIVSNVFDFQGRYLLDEENLRKAFDEKDPHGFGIPAWEGQQSAVKNYIGFEMYKATSDDYSLGFPWDMPKIFDLFEPAGSGQVGQKMAETYKESDISMALFYGYRPSDQYRGKFVGMAVGLTTPRTESTYDDPPGNYPDVANHIQWAVPKKSVPAKPFTYLWINAHSAHNQDGYYTSKKSITELFPGKDSDEYELFLKQKNVRSQPMVVVHQTNATFGHQLGKAPRLHAMITTDLMITELTYKEDSGKNYSVVELQNPSKLDINLNEYALVRLRFDGNKMSYLRTDNTFTDRLEDLSDADFYFLKDLKESDMVSIYKPNNDQASVEYGAKESAYAGTYVGSVNRYFNKFEENGKKLLAAGQIVLIGASGYEIKSAHLELKSWWPTFFPRDPRYNSWYLAQKRFRYFARTSHSNVLDINSGNNTQVKDGLALVKLFTTQQGKKKKVIDTTAPIGLSGFGFSGTLYDYKQEFNKVATTTSYYSQKRKDGVVFPFMAPYRTKRVETDSWSDDWELLANRNDLGYRWLASIDAAGRISGGRIMNLHRYRYFAKERTPLGQPDKYMSSRPEQR
ncbi:hypothetical protein [Porphyromonas sp. COT-290 OH3588]|uniref:hypothetical protein n=1 Tax=Porphyromonas sp. COT-290 OH3588 TaxID=1515617 RepID=UPI00052BE2D3|nr:hypothetical protein [Porphyromonas sp. COT-290 OH3588]KGO00206.1 hypothetical protein HQ48_06590 [Porphyromonas sp. COT-290 OH3588]